ncbi:MAG: tRNA pseudouridine(55) synthase TruB [Candidatus Tectomicrobia bacterium RIFCSPLOWO2_12_FULL_69_37]|nr:MAG: tRNA pseudouridine(55) synthase TruB [Candidatus Tectomicrobia bacterium RIFCSPLOWO2_12_FULL_69_37]
MKLSGALNLRKAAGPTSHDLVDAVRRLVPPRTKVGHAGTLDPMAEGVLPICLGAATKLFPYLLDCRKTYRAVVRFGRVTDTQDATGRVLAEREPGEITAEGAQRLLETFMGESVQVPPMYSALKQGGTRLHELARAGVEVERKGRPIRVYAIRALEAAGPLLTFEVTCSRGTYIRVLCHDLGALQGAGGCLEALTRTALGPFRLEEARTLDEVRALAGEGRLEETLVSPAEALSHLPALTVRPEAEGRLRHGGALKPRDWAEGEDPPGEGRVRLLSPGGELLAVGRVLPPKDRVRGWVAPDRVFAE